MGNLGVYPGKLGKKIYDLCLRNKLHGTVYKTLGTNLNDSTMFKYGWKLVTCLRVVAKILHIDGKFNNDVFLFALATSKIT